MILLRTEYVDDRLEAFAARLEALSGLPVAYLVDERQGPVACGARAKVSVTRKACRALGLYCPDDFAWRCGDYGFYLGRARYPAARYLWMIENDVRITGRKPEQLFAKFADEPADLIASYLDAPDRDWPWSATVESSDASPRKCFFPVVRLSARAIDVLLAKRREHGRQWSRRKLWPNDEAFVATAAEAAGLSTIDLNHGDPPVYREDEFSFDTIRDGDLPLPGDAEAALFHPVLFGAALQRKRARLAARRQPRAKLDLLGRKLNRSAGPEAIARRINRNSPW